MSTKRSLIEQAAAEFGLTGFDISPEEMQDGLTRLNRMAAMWDGQGITVGYDAAAGVEDESGVPADAEACFALNLAVQWAATFGKTVSPDTRKAARDAWGAMYTKNVTTPTQSYNPALPLGTGNRVGRGPFSRKYFPEV